jgi:hypothetical protein
LRRFKRLLKEGATSLRRGEVANQEKNLCFLAKQLRLGFSFPPGRCCHSLGIHLAPFAHHDGLEPVS